MNTAVIELDALADPVGAAAQNHDLLPVLVDRVLIRRIVGGIEVSAALRAAHMHPFPGLFHTQCQTAVSDLRLRNLQQLTQIFIGKSVLLGRDQHLIRQLQRTCPALILQNGLFFLHQLLHLLDKICLYLRDLVDLLHRRALSERFIHQEMPLAGRGDQPS